MFDIGAQELLLTAVVAIVVIGPKDLPRALRMAGGWIAKIRRVSGHFRSGIEEMIRQAELDEMEKKWREKNEAIMKGEVAAGNSPEPASAEAALPSHLSDNQAPGHHAAQPAPAETYQMDPYSSAPSFAPAPPETPAHEPAGEHASPELPLAPPAKPAP